MEKNDQESQPKKSKVGLIIIIILLLLVIIFFVWWFILRTKNTANTNNSNQTTKNTNAIIANTTANTNLTKTNTSVGTPVNIVALIKFTTPPTDWFEEVWFQAKSASGEVTYGADGVTFTGIQSNSRSGIMTNVEQDVSVYSHLNLHLIVTNKQQRLTGTGWNGREAPVAVAISYLDAAGTEHKALGEDPAAAGQVFWRGFYALDPTGESKATNGIKVTSGEKYTYDFDLMTLNPKPTKIHYVAVEGAGWQPRQGTVHELSLIGTK